MLSTVGDLDRSSRLHREGVELARHYGSRLEPWLVVECALDDYIAGEWDAAIAGARSYLARGAGEQFMDSAAHHVLAATATARGDTAIANAHVQAMAISLAGTASRSCFSARSASAPGSPSMPVRREQSRRLVDELAAAYS